MKFSVSKTDLANTLSIVLRGTSLRSTLPILSGILIDVRDNKAVFQTTDFEISIKHTIAVDVQDPGKTVVPGKLFNDIIKSLPDAAVSIENSGDIVTISCMDSSFTLSTLNPADFPYFPEVNTSFSITLPTKDIEKAINCVGRAASHDDSRPILTGILFSVENGSARCVATDSYRLAYADLETNIQGVEDFQAIIPSKIFEAIAKAATSEDDITISFSDNQIVFVFGNTIFVSRKIEGTYPNYKQLLPKEKVCVAQVDTSSIITAIKRVALLAQAHTPVKLSFSVENQEVTISSRTQDIGGATEKLKTNITGDSIEIAFNHQYILDGLQVIDGDTIFELQASLKPGIIKSSENKNYLYLTMPVRLS